MDIHPRFQRIKFVDLTGALLAWHEHGAGICLDARDRDYDIHVFRDQYHADISLCRADAAPATDAGIVFERTFVMNPVRSRDRVNAKRFFYVGLQ